MGRGQASVGGVALERVGQAALRLPHRGDVVGEPPLRPAAHGSRRRRGARTGRPRRPGCRCSRPCGMAGSAGHRSSPPVVVTIRLAGLGLDLRPGLVGALGEADVVGPVIGQPDDPAVVGGGAVGVVRSRSARARGRASPSEPAQPVGGAGSDRRRGRRRSRPSRGGVGHAPRPPAARADWSASRSTATDRHHVADPAVEGHRQHLVERQPADLELLGPVGRRDAVASGRSRGTGPRARRDAVGEVDPGQLRQSAALTPVSSTSSRWAPSSGVSPVGHAAFRDLPRVRVERVAVLADEQRRDPRRRGRGRRPRGSRSGRRRRCPGSPSGRVTSSCQTVSHGFS